MHHSHMNIVIALIAYALASIFSLLGFTEQKASNVFRKIGNALFTFATFLITLVTIQSYNQAAYMVTSSLTLTTAISWITLFIHIVFKLNGGIILASPIATLVILIEMFQNRGGHFEMSPPPLLLNIHITTAIIGEAFAIASFIWAIMDLYQKNAMKKKKINLLLQNSMNLGSTEKALNLCLWVGFIFLTIGLLLGAIANQFSSLSETNVAGEKILWAIGVWICYLSALIVHYTRGANSKRTAQITVFGFIIMSLGLFGLTSWR